MHVSLPGGPIESQPGNETMSIAFPATHTVPADACRKIKPYHDVISCLQAYDYARRSSSLLINSPRSMEREVSCMSSSTVERDIYRAV